MMSMFSSFDLYFFKFVYMSILIFSFLMFNCFYKINSTLVLMNKISKFMENFFYSIKTKGFNKTVNMFLLSLFFMLLFFNFYSVLSFNFPVSSQLSVISGISFSLWLSLMIFNLRESFKGFLAHCIPEGTPIFLTWFLFFIEVVSNIIRPITVTVRLTANILAGHLLMILLSKLVFLLPVLSLSYIILNLVEMCVALIQSYIFCTMMVLYYSEIK